MSEPPILLGTSSFTPAGWGGTFYPKRMQPADYLSFYAKHFHTVEVDSTFYACPAPRTVTNWASRTPEGFVFSVKVPQVITHEKVLTDCDAELKQFLNTMDILGKKLGPVVFQFPFFNEAHSETGTNFSTGSSHSRESCQTPASSRLKFPIEPGWTPNFRLSCAITKLLSCCKTAH